MGGSRRVIVLVLLAGLLAVSPALGEGGQDGGSKTKEPVKLTMFMPNYGSGHPAGVNPSDNWVIKIIEDYAKVDLEIEVPPWGDWATKCNLLLASGNLPDLIHADLYGDMLKAAEAGAFLDIKKYYDKSAVVKKLISPESFALSKSPSGKYWSIPMANLGREPGWGVIVRYDLLKEYNGGTYPEDVDGYLDWFRWIRKTYPDSVPIASRVGGGRIFVNSACIFAWYAGEPYYNTYRNGKVISNILLPETRSAVMVYRQMYQEGILDKEFATIPQAAYFTKLREKRVATETNSIDQLLPIVDAYMKTGRHCAFAAPLKRYPAGVDAQNIYRQSSDYSPYWNERRTAIYAKTAHPNEAWKVIEAFSSDALRDAQMWGREGKEYTVVGGERVPTDRLYLNDGNDPDSHYWTLSLGITWGTWPTEGKYAVQKKRNPAEFAITYQSSRWLVEAGRKNGVGFGTYLPSFPEISAKGGDAWATISQILAKTISGEASMEDYDAMIGKYRETYGFIDDLRTTWIQENKASMTAMGWKGAGW
jgi:ABC-type glycerol-3-phosphate transport system substrate-binding protein